MSIRLKKSIKFIAIGLVSLILLVFLVIAIAVNFVLTSEKITPKVVEGINNQLNAEFIAEGFELSFFRTFPSFTLEVHNGGIINPIRDSLQDVAPKRRDTLLAFQRAQITVNPVAFLRNKIDIRHVIFDGPQIYAFTNRFGDVNWDILKETDSVIEEPKKEPKESIKVKIDLDNVSIRDGSLFIDNELTEIFAQVPDLELRLKAKYNPKNILLNLNTQADHIKLWKKGESIVEDLEFTFNSDLNFDRNTKIFLLNDARVGLNEVEMLANGTLHRDSAKKLLDIDLNLAFEMKSIENFIKLLPEGWIDKSIQPQTEGTMAMKAQIKGPFGNGVYPMVDAEIKIMDGAVNYPNQTNQIEELSADLSLHLDQTNASPSYLNFDHFIIKGKNTDVRLDGKVENIFGNPEVNFKMLGKIDLKAMQNTFPFREGWNLSGLLNSNFETHFFKNDLNKGNFGNIMALGNIEFSDLIIENKKESIIFSTPRSKLNFVQQDNSTILTKTPSKVLAGKIELDDFNFRNSNLYFLSTERFHSNFVSNPDSDTLKMKKVSAKVDLGSFKYNQGDSIKALVKRAFVDLEISPTKALSQVIQVNSKMSLDSSGIQTNRGWFTLKNSNYQLKLFKEQQKKWQIEGTISFEELNSLNRRFPLKFQMPKTQIQFKEDEVLLNHASFKIGRSDLKATGNIADLRNWYFSDSILKGRLKIESKLLDVNEIIYALNESKGNLNSEMSNSSEIEAIDPDPISDSQVEVFQVPADIDLNFQSSIEVVLYKKIRFDKLKGAIVIKDQAIELENLRMSVGKAQMYTSIDYKAQTKNNAKLNFDYLLRNVNIASLIELMPILDTIMPMANSLEGTVNFRFKGNAALSQKLSMNAPTLNAIARIQGLNMVVLDGETYRKVAKMLFFKDKTKNIIKEMSFALEIENSKLEVFPSDFYVDRYHLALGGFHRLDDVYSFHISVLKTPVPLLKLGIDVKGSRTGTEFDMTSARYKLFFAKSAKRRAKADQELMQRKEEVIRQLPFN